MQDLSKFILSLLINIESWPILSVKHWYLSIKLMLRSKGKNSPHSIGEETVVLSSRVLIHYFLLPTRTLQLPVELVPRTTSDLTGLGFERVCWHLQEYWGQPNPSSGGRVHLEEGLWVSKSAFPTCCGRWVLFPWRGFHLDIETKSGQWQAGVMCG